MAARRCPTLTARFRFIALLCIAACSGACGTNDWLTDETAKITLNGHTFELELAIDEEARTRGLSGRESIDEFGGMLFVFPDRDIRRFWMKDCLVDIDILFLDGRGFVTATHRMDKEPPRRPDESLDDYERRLPLYSSVLPAQFAIELRAGWLDELELDVDDRVDLDVNRLKNIAR